MTEDRVKEVRKKFRLFGLPYEVRHEILGYVADAMSIAVYLPGIGGMPSTAIPLPLVTQVGDRRLRLETILLAIKQTTLEIHSGPANQKLQVWLASLNFSHTGNTSLCNGFDAVHSLRFPYFSRFPHRILAARSSNNDIDLMRRCANLRSVSLHFVHSELIDYTTGLAKSVAQLRAEYRFDCMRNLRNLSKLELEGPSPGTVGHTVTVALAAWFRWEYALHGKALQVTIP